MFLQGSDIITMTLSLTELNCYNNISTDHFVLLYIPSFNLGIFMIKAFLFQEKETFLSRAYYQFLMPVESSLENNFEEIDSIKDIPHITLFGNSIHIYTVEYDDPMLVRLYEYLYNDDNNDSLQSRIKSVRFRNILLGI